ncbi:MAG: LLM class flavin-dependent oxidoreductase [Chloroflexi bacterium]|nr:LLM class flavin-dependent oxidoreductase [Chloroflexota bacterium]
MQSGICVPNFGLLGNPSVLVSLAREAEAAGWDGFFPWDHLLVDRSWRTDIADTPTVLAAIAASTSRIRLGPMVAALPRRRPWLVARATATIDVLSEGRLILGVGLGWPTDPEFTAVGDEADLRRRAEMLDESLAILEGCWSGEPFAFEGRHYRLAEAAWLPRPVQRPRIPVWVGALRPFRDGPLRRAARWDGVFPATDEYDFASPADVADVAGRVAAIRRPGSGPFDIVVQGITGGVDAAADEAVVAPYREAGATWWLELVSEWQGDLEAIRDRVRRGPPAG